jgi:hypothetical protein
MNGIKKRFHLPKLMILKILFINSRIKPMLSLILDGLIFTNPPLKLKNASHDSLLILAVSLFFSFALFLQNVQHVPSVIELIQKILIFFGMSKLEKTALVNALSKFVKSEAFFLQSVIKLLDKKEDPADDNGNQSSIEAELNFNGETDEKMNNF